MGIKEIFKWMGHKLKLEKIALRLRDVEFCHCRMLRAGEGLFDWRLVRDPVKCLSTFGVSMKHQHEPVGGGAIYRSICLGEAIVNEGVPLLQDFFWGLQKAMGRAGVKLGRIEEDSALGARVKSFLGSDRKTTLIQLAKRWRPKPIAMAARVSFHMLWGDKFQLCEVERMENLWGRYVVSSPALAVGKQALREWVPRGPGWQLQSACRMCLSGS